MSKRHVVEPFELPAAEMDAFWREAMLAARAVAGAATPRKMHLFPRFDGDPFEGGPIDPRRASFRRGTDDLARLAATIAAVR